MKFYVCRIYTTTTRGPRLAAIKCETEQDIPSAAADLARYWPTLTALEVYDDERRLWILQKDPSPLPAGTPCKRAANSN